MSDLPRDIDAIPPWPADPAAYYNYAFGYDGLGRRVWTQSNSGNGSWFIYDGDQLVQERDYRSDALIVEYAWGPTTGAPAIFYQRRLISGTPQERWIYTSPQGAFPRHLFDDTGAITDTFQYSSFGELVFHAGSTEVAFGWMGGWSLKTQSVLNPSLWLLASQRYYESFLGVSIAPATAKSQITAMRALGAKLMSSTISPTRNLNVLTAANDDGFTPPGGADCTNDCCYSSALRAAGAGPSEGDKTFPPGEDYQPGRVKYNRQTGQIEHEQPGSNSCTATLVQDVRRVQDRALQLLVSGCIEKGSPLSACLTRLTGLGGALGTDVKITCQKGCKDQGWYGYTQCHTSPPTIQICLDETSPSVGSWFEQGPGEHKPPRDSVIFHELLHVCLCEIRTLYRQFDDYTWDVVQACMQYRCEQSCGQTSNWGWGDWGSTHFPDCTAVEDACPRLSVTCGGARCNCLP